MAWLTGAAWPTWLDHGVDWRQRAFREDLYGPAFESRADYRRLRVAARQTFVFARAASAGLSRAGEAVEIGVEFLLGKARQSDGGYARRFDLHNVVVDHERDLYDHAFVLLALAEAASVLPSRRLRAEALNLVCYLDATMAHPLGGFRETLPASLPRRQNPHMHLLEASLSAAEAFGDQIFFLHAEQMVALFVDRFFDAKSNALPEYYADDLEPLMQEGRYAVEPGHLCEWIWLLWWFARIMPHSTLNPAAERASCLLRKTIDRTGIHPVVGTVYNEIWSDGTVKQPDSRLWPQSERLKMELARPDRNMTAVLDAFGALNRHIEPATKGLWIERLGADGTPVIEPAPASSLYHLTVAIEFASARLNA